MVHMPVVQNENTPVIRWLNVVLCQSSYHNDFQENLTLKIVTDD